MTKVHLHEIIKEFIKVFLKTLMQTNKLLCQLSIVEYAYNNSTGETKTRRILT